MTPTAGSGRRAAPSPVAVVRSIRVREGALACSDEGPREGEPLVLLHGFTGSHRSFAGLRAALAGEHRVIAFDLPGHGATHVADAAFDMAGAAQALVDALDAIGVGRFRLLGYSMGGRLAVFLAIEAGRRITGLVLESTSAGIADEEERARRQAADQDLACSIERDGIRAFIDRWERLSLFASLADLPASTRRRLREERLRADPAGLATSLRGMGTGVQPWLGDRLGEITAPTLVVSGERDRKFGAIASMLAASIPDARRCVVPGAGHLPHLEQPGIFHDAVAGFLRSLGGGPQ